jgi:transposase InsO family protein
MAAIQSSEVTQKVPLLTRDNYDCWAKAIKWTLMRNEEWAATQADDNAQPPIPAAIKMKALCTIGQAVSLELQWMLDDCDTPKKAWDKLKTHFSAASLANVYILRQELITLRKSSSETFDEYLERAEKLRAKLASINSQIPEPDFIMYMLSGLTPEFDAIVAILKSETPQRSLQAMSSMLRGHEVHVKSRVNGTSSNTDKALYSSQGKTTKQKKVPPHLSECHNCHRIGHWARDCPDGPRTEYGAGSSSGSGQGKALWQPNDRAGGGKSGKGQSSGKSSTKSKKKSGNHRAGHAHLAVESDCDDSFENDMPISFYVSSFMHDADVLSLVVSPELCVPSCTYGLHVHHKLAGLDHSSWVIDSGATNHMTPEREKFTEYRAYGKPTTISVGDAHKLEVHGVGTTYIVLQDVASKRVYDVKLEHVLHVPNLAANLISVPSVTKTGKQVVFTKNKCVIKDGGKFEISIPKVNSLYVAQESVECTFAAVNSPNDYNLLHKRLGHLGHTSILKLIEHQSVKGLESFVPYLSELRKANPVSDCEACIMGSQARESFPSSDYVTRAPLELVHTDVCGPMDPMSHDKKQYFLTLLDDYSGMSAVVVISHKSEVSQMLIEALEDMETACGHKVKAVRSDRGGEYVSKTLDEYLRSRRISHQFTAPYTPQQNGKAERLNRTLVEKTRALLIDANLPKNLWTEALRTANYLRNRATPAVRDESKTPAELFLGRKPNIAHLRCFGCVAYTITPTHKTKLENRSEKGYFVGYDTNQKAFRVWIPKRGVVIRRDVKFIENGLCAKVGESSSMTKSEEPVYVEIPVVRNQPMVGPAAVQQPEPPAQPVQQPVQVQQPGPPPGPPVQPQPIPAGRSSDRVRMPPACWRYDPGNPQAEDYNKPRLHLSLFEDIASCFVARADEDPLSVEEAMGRPDADLWKQAIKEELQSFVENNTYEVVEAKPGLKLIPLKWILKRKRDDTGKVTRYKARLVAKGFRQRAGIDYHEIYAPVCKSATIRTLFTYAAVHDLEVDQLDVKTAFLYGELQEDIYTELPPGFQDQSGTVWKLRKSVYGLKQAPRVWYEKLATELSKVQFVSSSTEPGLFVKEGSDHRKTYLAVHVDDILLVGDAEQVREAKEALSHAFQIHDLGGVKYYLGMEINRSRSDRMIYLSQQSYIKKVLERFEMSDCKPKTVPLATGTVLMSKKEDEDVANVPYMELIGSLLYVSVWSRPDIAFHVSSLARFMSAPAGAHWKAGMNILRYLKHTMAYALHLGCNAQSPQPIVYADADYAGDIDGRKSTSGFLLQWHGSSVQWGSKLQSSVAVSTAEAEYIAMATAVKEALWLKNLLSDFDIDGPMQILNDNSAALSIANNPMCAKRAKHIDTQWHFVRDRISKGDIIVQYCPTEFMVADILTKILPEQKHKSLVAAMKVFPV